jgi:hypothetical protein
LIQPLPVDDVAEWQLENGQYLKEAKQEGAKEVQPAFPTFPY